MTKYLPSLLIVFTLSVALLVTHLARPPFDRADEALHAQVVSELQESDNFFHLTYLGESYYRKPPLYFWLSAVSTRILGNSKLSFRLVSVCSAFLLILLLAYWALLLTNSNWAVVGTVAFLLSSQKLIFMHGFRSGVPDALLLFLISAASFFIWSHFAQSVRSEWRLTVIGVLVGLAILTKSLFGLLPLTLFAGMLSFQEPKLPRREKLSILIFVSLIALTVSASYYLPLVLGNRGEMYTTFKVEIWERAVNGLHNSPSVGELMSMIALESFYVPSLVLWGVVLYLLLQTFRADKNIYFFLLLWTSLVLLGCLGSKTRLIHYFYPALPAWALGFGLTIDGLQKAGQRFSSSYALSSLLLLMVSVSCIKNIEYALHLPESTPMLESLQALNPHQDKRYVLFRSPNLSTVESASLLPMKKNTSWVKSPVEVMDLIKNQGVIVLANPKAAKKVREKLFVDSEKVLERALDRSSRLHLLSLERRG